MPGLPESVFFALLSTDSYLSEEDKTLKKLESLLTYLLIDAKTDSSISVFFLIIDLDMGVLRG
jgi:hypothetical protein